MPTKSNNIGGWGGARSGAGRKKTPLIERIEAETDLTILDIPEIEGTEMPEPSDFLSAVQKDGSTLQAAEIYEKTWNWLKEVGCAAKVSPQLIERYAMASARWIHCEEAISKYGYLASHPTTTRPIQSPFVNMAVLFSNLADRLWNEIFQIVKENCTTTYSGGSNPEDDVMERLLRARGN